MTDFGEIGILVFGQHNLQNISGAKYICNEIGVFDEDFYRAIATFEGAANRLQLQGKNEQTTIYKDFAHSPSKLAATTKAMKQQFAQQHLIAVMELHTFSSLNKEFLNQYAGSMNQADTPVVFLDKETFAHKNMDLFDETLVREAFDNDKLKVITDREVLKSFLINQSWSGKNLLLMTSGNFSGLNLDELTTQILNQ